MIRIELLYLADCPHTEQARDLLRACLSELALTADVEELEGDYPSPTIRVNGQDVMGRPEIRQAACRLDIPTRERLVAALQGAMS